MYLRNLTNEELLRGVVPVSELEKELFKRLEIDAALHNDDLQEAYDEIAALIFDAKTMEETLEGCQDDYDDLLLKCNALESELEDLRDSACKVGRFNV